MDRTKKSKLEAVKDFYRLYTSGLTRGEIEGLLKYESADILSYYRRGTKAKSVDDEKSRTKREFLVIKELFISFLLKLTPARRLFYGVALSLFVFAMFATNWTYAFFSFVILNLLLAFELADKMVARDELEIARNIQLGLQPKQNPRISGLQIASFYQPAREVGGDYFGLIKLDDHKFALIVGDVSGKGMPAALYAVQLQSLFELLVKIKASPKKILAGINDIMSRRLKKSYFITAVAAIVDVKGRKLTLARAGHNPPIHYCSKRKEVIWLNPRGIGIGIDKNSNFDKELTEEFYDFSPGDMFLFYTDGVTEARKGPAEFGEKRLAKAIVENAHLSVEQLKENLVANLNEFVQKALWDDDATFVVLRVGK